jgi:uncharacterized protein (DUF2141 family)
MSKTSLVLLLVACPLAPACKDEPPPTPVVAASAVVQAPVEAGPTSMKLVIDAAGKTSIDMPAPAEHLKAETAATSGEIVVDPSDLSKTHGQVKVDVTTLTTHTFNDDRDKLQSEHALNWLEVGKLVTPEVKDGNRWAIFTIRSIDGLGNNDLATFPLTHGAGDETRTVTAEAKGDFFIHGHQVAKSATVEVVFHYATGDTAAKKPVGVDIKTKTPLHVILAEHDIKPRDNLGKLAQATASLVSKVAETADVTFDLTAHVAP